MQDDKAITAETLAGRMTEKRPAGKGLLARLTLCAALTGGTAQAGLVPDGTTTNDAYSAGHDAGLSYGQYGPVTSTSPYGDPSLDAAFQEGYHDGLCEAGFPDVAEGVNGVGCGDDTTSCSTCSSCGCGCGG
jgi:hypothetical protein